MHGTGLIDKIRKTSALAAAATGATSAVNSTVVDTAGAEGVVFSVLFGTAAANNGLKVQQGTLADGSDMADLAGSQILGNTRLVVAQVHKPTKRYLRAVAIRGTSSTVDGITADVYGVRTLPAVSTGTTVESSVSPVEGTA